MHTGGSPLPPYLFTGQVVQVIRHLPSFARLYWRLFRDRRVSILSKAFLVLVFVYVFSPFDVVPDFIPVLGEMDDVAVLFGGLWTFVRLCPPAVVREKVLEISARAGARA